MRPNLPVNTRRSAVDVRSFLSSVVYHFPFFTIHACDLFRLTTQWLSDSLITDGMERMAKKGPGMLRVPQHERKIITDIKFPPFVLSTVEGLREAFSARARISSINAVTEEIE